MASDRTGVAQGPDLPGCGRGLKGPLAGNTVSENLFETNVADIRT